MKHALEANKECDQNEGRAEERAVRSNQRDKNRRCHDRALGPTLQHCCRDADDDGYDQPDDDGANHRRGMHSRGCPNAHDVREGI